jgi:hypothetical protein
VDTLLRRKRGNITVHADGDGIDIFDDENFVIFPWNDINWLIKSLRTARDRRKEKWTSKRSA